MADYFRKAKSLFSTTANTFSTGDGVTITPNSVTGLPTDCEICLTFDRVDSGGTATPTKMERIIGVITGGNFVVRATTGRGADGTTDQAHTSPVVEYIPNAKDMNDQVDGLLIAHAQTGIHKSGATYAAPVFSGSATGTYTLVGPVWDGWSASADTWTYVSASSFKISGADRTAIFTKGTKIKLTQTSAKYFYVVSSAFSTDTTVTVTGGTDYTLANAAITLPNYSYVDNPQGFPVAFAYTPTYGANGSMTYTDVSTVYANFSIRGKVVHLEVGANGTIGGTPSTALTITLPVNCLNDNGNVGLILSSWVFDSSVIAGVGIIPNNTSIGVYKYDAANYGTGTTKYVVINGDYIME